MSDRFFEPATVQVFESYILGDTPPHPNIRSLEKPGWVQSGTFPGIPFGMDQILCFLKNPGGITFMCWSEPHQRFRYLNPNR